MNRAYILVVDDEQAMIDLLRVMLRLSNYHVEGALTGAEAIVVATEAPPALVLLDLMMPDISGFEVVRALRQAETTRHVPIAIITARPGSLVEAQAQEYGVDFFLHKPVTRAQLLELLEKVQHAPSSL